MNPTIDAKKIISKKIKNMSPEKINEVLDFIEFITLKDYHRLMLSAQQKAASKHWDDPKLDIYND